jgi:pimeloyl-ACP methyl ester carboxylesterase
MRHWAAWVGFGLALVGAAAEAKAQPVDLKFEPIQFKLRDGSEVAADRGTFSVPEDRNNRKSRRISIGFVRFKSTNPQPGAPIVYLAGGPGGSGVATAQGPRQPIFLALRAVADVIAFDQRGTGLSAHVPPCSAEEPFDPAVPLTEASLTAHYRAAFRHCLRQWRAAGVAVNGYTTAQSAQDIDDLRRALGVRKVDLWGISYGTHLALAAMRAHPDSIGRAALASVEGMSQTVKLPGHLDRAYRRIDAALGDSVPKGGLATLVRSVHAKFDAAPQAFTHRTSDGRTVQFRTDSFPLRTFAGFLPKNPDGYPTLVGGYRALDAGQNGAVAPYLYDFFLKDAVRMNGMTELMDLASGITDARLARVRREARDSLLGTAVNFPMPQLRGAHAEIDLGDRFREEIRSDIPVLVLSGDLDVRTPLEEQAEAIAGLTNKHQIIVRNGGHDLFEAHPGVPQLLIEFFSGRKVTVKELELPRPSL